MKTVTELLPLAIGIAVVGAVTGLLLARGWTFGAWLLAVLLFGHGWVHLLFVFPQPEPAAAGPAWPFDMAQSWVATRLGVDVAIVRALGIGLMVVVFTGFALAALATVGIFVSATAWSGLVLGSAIASIVLLTLFFSPSLILGIAIDGVLLGMVLRSVWSPIAGGPLGGGG